jgi:hypothetical protein
MYAFLQMTECNGTRHPALRKNGAGEAYRWQDSGKLAVHVPSEFKNLEMWENTQFP